MDGADHDQPRRRQLDGEEQALAADLYHARDTRTETRRKLVTERIVGVALALDHQPRLAGRGIGDEDRRLASVARRVEPAEHVELHARALGLWAMFMMTRCRCRFAKAQSSFST